MSNPTAKLDAHLRSGASGLIQRRQSTFWELCLEDDPMRHRFRVHFHGKQEFRYAEDQFHGGGFFAEHPVLQNLNEPSANVYLAGPSSNPSQVLAELRSVVQRWSDGWRTAEEYLNEHTCPEDMIAAGYGLLLTGPKTLADQCAQTLRGACVSFSIVDGSDARAEPHRVVVLGQSFVIAHSFVTEVTDN